MLFASTSSGGMRIDNRGASNSYDLKVRFVGMNDTRSFSTGGVIIPANCSHQIEPDWRHNDGRVQVLVDSGFTGTFADTLYLTTSYLCGSADGQMPIDIADAVYLVNYIFAGGAAPLPLASGDADCSGDIDIADAAYLVSYIFSGGPAPCAACI